jgi:perosamine synthetase
MIHLSKPWVTYLERAYVAEAVYNGDIGVGAFITQFERAWSDVNRMNFGVACNSGTNALFLALKALGIKDGDKVIVPEFTMAATAWAVSYTGATPVFVDCDDNLTIDIEKLREIDLTDVKAIMPVLIYGREVNHEVYEYARKHKLYIVEDMAEAHGILPKGDIACYSFYGNKILTTGEGGMCLTNNEKWANEMRSLANMYFDKNRSMIHPKMGYNFRMTNIQAAFGLAQVERLDEILRKRKEICDLYTMYLPEDYIMPPRKVGWMYDIRVENQEETKKTLLEYGVDSRYFFRPMSEQPMYKGEYEHLNAYKWSKQGLYLPLYPQMTEVDVKYIVRCLK